MFGACRFSTKGLAHPCTPVCSCATAAVHKRVHVLYLVKHTGVQRGWAPTLPPPAPGSYCKGVRLVVAQPCTAGKSRGPLEALCSLAALHTCSNPLISSSVLAHAGAVGMVKQACSRDELCTAVARPSALLAVATRCNIPRNMGACWSCGHTGRPPVPAVEHSPALASHPCGVVWHLIALSAS